MNRIRPIVQRVLGVAGWGSRYGPWRALGDPRNQKAPAVGERWRVNFSRVEWRTTISRGRYEKVEGAREDNWVWSPQGLVNMHYPEMWGYVQFSERASDAFVPDPSAEESWFLRRVYYRQRNRFARRGDFAEDLLSLGLVPPAGRRFSMHRTPGLFEATIETENGGRLTITRDGRLRGGR